MNSLYTPERYGEIVTINVDVQNDFMPDGSLPVMYGDEVVSPLNHLNQWTRDRGGSVVFTRDWHPDETAHFQEFGGPWPPHCRRYRAGAAFHNELQIDVEGGDTIASKGMGRENDDYSGYLAQIDVGRLADLVAGLPPEQRTVAAAINRMIEIIGASEERKRLAIIVGGLATDYCVKATALDALAWTERFKRASGSRDIDVFIVPDAMRAVNVAPDDGDRTLTALEEAGALALTSQEIIDGSILMERST